MVSITFNYLVQLETRDGIGAESEIHVDYDNPETTDDGVLDETARRYIVSTLLSEGSRAIKIKRL